MRRFRAIVESKLEPQDKEVLWYYKNKLLYYNNGVWVEFIKEQQSIDTSNIVNSMAVSKPDFSKSRTEQLYTTKNDGHTKQNINPITTTESVYDKDSNVDLKSILSNISSNSNHIFIEFIKNISETRLSVPRTQRKKGLEVTFVSPEGIIYNQQYLMNNIEDINWVRDANWKDSQAPELEWITIT